MNRSPARVLVVSPLFARALEVALEMAADDGRPRRPDALRPLVRGRALGAAALPPARPRARPQRRREGAGRRRGRGDSRRSRLRLRRRRLAVRGPVDVALPAGGAIRVVTGGLATSGTASRGAHLVDTATGRAERVVAGSRSRRPARAASPPTSPRRPASCSASAGRRGSTSAGSRAASSASTARSSRTTRGRARRRRCRRARDLEPGDLVRGPRLGRRGVRRPQLRRLPRAHARRQGTEPPLAALLGRGRPPLRRPPRRLAHRRPRPDHRGRLVPALLPAQPARAVHLDATGRSGRGSGSRAPSCSSPSRSRTTTGSGCRTASGGRRTTSTSPSGGSPRCTG